MRWIALFRPGDYLLVLLAGAACIASFPLAWQGGSGDRVVIRRGGEIFATLDLNRNRRIEVPGPLGITLVAVDKRRVRVVSDPGPHQYCVRQGWLERAGEIAICAPNEVSVQVLGAGNDYDSLNY